MQSTNFFQKINNIIYKYYPLTLIDILGSVVLMFGFYLSSLFSYNLFHASVEFVSIMISFAIFIIIWNAREYLTANFFLFIGIAYLFISFIDIAHTLAFPGMNLFITFDPTTNLSTQLWITARYIQAISLLIAPFLLTRKTSVTLIFGSFTLMTLLIFYSIFALKIFPTAFIDGVGLTLFKIISEYIISVILVISAILLYKKRQMLNRNVFQLLITSIIFTLISEVFFTSYVQAFDLSNMLGHYFKLVAFMLMYKAISEIGLRHPLVYIFNKLKKNNEVLKSSETKFRSLVELATDAVILTNGIDEIVLWNKSAESIFGWKEKDIIDKSLSLVIPEKKNSGQILDIKRYETNNRDGFNTTIESSGIRKSGERFPLEFSFSSWKANNELFYCYIIRDTSERKIIEKEVDNQRRKLEKLVTDLKIVQSGVDNAFAHMIITDENGTILYANKSAEDLTGFSKEEMVGKKPSLWGKQMPLIFYQNLWKIIREDKMIFEGEIINKRKNGQLYEAEIRISPILDDNGSVKFFVAIEQDITDQKNIDKTKSEFLSIAAHQLKTPLATISIISEMLLRNIVGSSPKEHKKYLRSIFKEIKNMTKMIETFLDVSRIEMSKFPQILETHDLFKIIEEIVKEILPQMSEKKIHFKRSYKNNLPNLKLDKNAMQIIIDNLLSNAIKYTPKNGKIELRIEEKHNKIIVSVTDNGIGIPEKDKSKIFTKMFRAGNTIQIKSDGSGLGLYLVKNLAEQNGYSVFFDSKENEGTTFFVSIPRKEAPQSDAS